MITKKHIFLSKLKGKPVKIFNDGTSVAEIDLLIECGIIFIDRKRSGTNYGVVGYPIEILEGNPVYRAQIKKAGDSISFRR